MGFWVLGLLNEYQSSKLQPFKFCSVLRFDRFSGDGSLVLGADKNKAVSFCVLFNNWVRQSDGVINT